MTSLRAINLKTSASDGIELQAYTTGANYVANVTTNVKVKEIWLYAVPGANLINGSNGATNYLAVFYKDTSDSKMKLFGQVNLTSTDNEILRVNYGNTKDTNIVLDNTGGRGAANGGVGTEVNLTLDIIGDTTTGDLWDGYDNLIMNWGLTGVNGTFDSLGDTASTEESGELLWGQGLLAMGTKDEDHRSAYGIVIKNPKSQSSSEQVELSIPQDQVKANIVIKGTSSTISGGDTTYVPVQVTPVTKFASEVSSASAYNLILVGGPCANALVEDLFDMTCEGWAYAEGEAVIKLAENGDNVALLVAGTSGEDTRRAAKALLSYSDYDFSGSEVIVSGTSLEDINVEAI